MTLSDRIAVMKDGKLMQIGTPSEIYNNPANKFVAGFVGSPAMNFISGELKLIDNKNYFVFEMGKIELPELLKEKIKESIKGKDVVLGIRPEDIEISFEKDNNSLTGVTSIRETLGSDDYVTVEMGNILLTVRVEPEKFIPMDEKCYLKLKGNKMHLFNKDED